MATVGTAYVQIVPSAQGISGSIKSLLGGEATAAGKSAGQSIGSSIVSTIGTAVAAAGIGKIISGAITNGANLEQSIGGVDTLFKESAGTVKRYAAEAYQTAGVSANDYMQQVTSFSASLLQSLGGDTSAAAETANMALVDMSDNANKFGSSMANIQNAYQGFAKQNYTMLDNLKLGYGGTKTEMERLLADAQKLTGVEYNIDNLDDVFQAIHVIQTELGVTGTTAQEASTTISGSMGQMKAAWENLQANMALGKDIGPSLTALGQSIITFGSNVIPAFTNVVSQIPTVLTSMFSMITPGMVAEGAQMIGNLVLGLLSSLPQLFSAGASLIGSIVQGLATAAPQLLSSAATLIGQLATGFLEAAPQMVSTGLAMLSELGNGLIEGLPSAITAIGSIVIQIVGAAMQAAPQLLSAGVAFITNMASGLAQNGPAVLSAIGGVLSQLIARIMQDLPTMLSQGIALVMQLASGLIQNAPAAVAGIGSVLAQVISTIIQNLPQFLAQGIALVAQLAAGLIQMIPSVISAALQIISNIKNSFTSIDWGSVGSAIISGIAAGIRAGVSTIINAARSAAQAALNAAKSFLGIASPSKEFAWIGRMTDEGYAEGIRKNIGVVDSAMSKLTDTTAIGTSMIRASGSSLGTNSGTASVTERSLGSLASSIVNGLAGVMGPDNSGGGEVALYLDDEKIGRLLLPSIRRASAANPEVSLA